MVVFLPIPKPSITIFPAFMTINFLLNEKTIIHQTSEFVHVNFRIFTLILRPWSIDQNSVVQVKAQLYDAKWYSLKSITRKFAVKGRASLP
jgi:hypothetical protein